MSLVQEALKRKSEEDKAAAGSTGNDSPTASPIPPPPPPAPPAAGPNDNTTPPPPDAPQKKRPGKGFIIWLLFLLILGSLSFAAYYLFTKGLADKQATASAESIGEEEQPAPHPTSTSVPKEVSSPKSTPVTEKETDAAAVPTRDVPFSERSTAYQLIQKTKNITQTEREQREEAAELMEQSKEKPAPTPTAIATSTPVPAPVIVQKKEPRKVKPVAEKITKKAKTKSPVPETATAKKTDRDVKTEKAPEEPVEWPRIRLNGVMATRNRTDGIAIIDGKLTGCGQEVNGVKLISVHKDGVVLEYEGEIRTLRVGGEMF